MSVDRIVGIIPAGGVASRLAPISCSKEVFPIGWQEGKGNDTQVPKVMGNYLLEYMKQGGADSVFFIIKEGKWDIPAYFKDGKPYGINISYLIADLPYGVPFTVNQATPFLHGETVLFGFPDILIRPENAFKKIVEKYKEGNEDVVLGIFEVENYKKWDLVITNDANEVVGIDIKPDTKSSDFAWAIACWGDRFTRFINDYCQETHEKIKNDPLHLQDFHLGHCLKAGLVAGLKIAAVKFPEGFSRDLGTPEDLRSIISENSIAPKLNIGPQNESNI